MIYSGIDLHKTNMVITTIDSNGAELAFVKLPCRKAEVSAYFSRFAGALRAVVESTGSWYWLSDLLAEMGVELILAHALQLKAIYTEATVRAVRWSGNFTIGKSVAPASDDQNSSQAVV